ncbi:Hpt domain-containing protein [Roseivivax isoporae]|uniref:Histidine kinase n=1 Tax=Roseivivax isoporae LMG 25204 TaxID=1449351 RepID=X7F9R3_9RHOB|nr:Hpt domain-containing protein [Roseivivax isoporae]ETX29632.1 histidine kinase [Roseivivax isoporae LMG 25204]
MIDWTQVRMLRSEIGEDGFAEVAEVFLEEMAAAVRDLPAADADALRGALHGMKGAASNLGMAALAEACARAERSDDPAAALPRDVLARMFDQSRAALLDGLARGAG